METADVVVLLHRPDTDERDHPRMGEADLAIVKNRYGAPGKVTIAHQLHYARFASMAAAPPPPPPSPPTTPPRPAASPPPATRPRPGPPPARHTPGDEERLITAGDVQVVMRSVGCGRPAGDLPGPRRPRRRRVGRPHRTARGRDASHQLPPSPAAAPTRCPRRSPTACTASTPSSHDSTPCWPRPRSSRPTSWSPARSARGSPTATPPAHRETSPGWC